MIALPQGFKATIFITHCERMVGVKLYKEGHVVGNLGIETLDQADALHRLNAWLLANGLEEFVGEKGCGGNNGDTHPQIQSLVTAVLDELETLKILLNEGPSPTVGWLGSPSQRRLGTPYCPS